MFFSFVQVVFEKKIKSLTVPNKSKMIIPLLFFAHADANYRSVKKRVLFETRHTFGNFQNGYEIQWLLYNEWLSKNNETIMYSKGYAIRMCQNCILDALRN